MPECEIIKFSCLQNGGIDCAFKTTLHKSITQLLNKNICQGGEVGLAGLGLCMTSNKVWILCEMVWMSVTSHGKYLWPPGTEKKDRKPLRATAGHLLLRLLHATWPLSLLGICVCVCVCAYTPLTECMYVCLCVRLHLHPVLAACPWLHHWRQLMLSHGGIVAAPAANNQRQLFGNTRDA